MNDIIPIDAELATFSEYLDNNCRGILSARFGDGKSFFLNEVKKHLSDKYIFITIYPVNYQVAENKDIFEYIKRDILLQILMSSEIDLSDDKFDFSLRLWGFFNQHEKDISSDIISLLVSSLSRIPQEAVAVFQKNIVKFKEYSGQINKSQSDQIATYLNEFVSHRGSIYEFDPMSQIIYQLIADIKSKNGKEVVLGIEDMDRIDPAHIFRILNVFSAHWDMQDYSEQKLTSGNPLNKYGFDKILLVCHFQNIKNIFHHFYGAKTDFIGYVHKFSSSAPYEYSLRDVIENWIQEKIPFDHKLYPDICRQLAALIMKKYANNADIITNIRHITSFLNHPAYNIKKKNIEFGHMLYGGPNYYIGSDNQVTRLLCILENFKITIDDFLGRFDSAGADNQHRQICHLISQCWVIYPCLETTDSVKDSFTFSNCDEHRIRCMCSNYQIPLTCVAQKDKHNPLYYKIESIEMANVLISPEFNALFCSKERYQTILSFFKKYIY
ncbi:hypothetical protein [Alistipes sp.]|uniref:hypothetical protein n=1 Tax=Alistipes sp. TaxID=1872444 RepID=UPI0035281914